MYTHIHTSLENTHTYTHTHKLCLSKYSQKLNLVKIPDGDLGGEKVLRIFAIQEQTIQFLIFCAYG